MSKEVRHGGAGAFEVRFPFDRALVDLIKTLPNRRWDAADRYWWVPENDVRLLVETLHPKDFRFDEATREAYRASGGTLPLEQGDALPPRLLGLFDPEPTGPMGVAAARDGTDYSVSELNRQVKAAIESAFPRPVWLVGEISGFNRNAHKKHVTFQLVEHDAQGKTLSKVDATLFDQARRAIEQALERAGNPFRLEDEIQVRVRARIELYVPWGSFRILVEELDPGFTLGEAARRREEIVRRLTEQGLKDRNRELEFPALPLRLGLVTSLGSDAHKDVVRTLEESGYAFRVVCHGARVQGRATEPSVLRALDHFRECRGDLDVVLICRGGGSRTDLAWFDSEALGRAVATFPLPVVIGIGHEQDRSVLDEVGWRAKTPTAAAALLVETVRRSVETLEHACAGILELAGRRLEEERQRQSARGRRLALATRALLTANRERLARWSRDVPRATTVHLTRQRSFLDGARRAVSQAARRDIAAAGGRLADTSRALAPRSLRRILVEQEHLSLRNRRLYLVDPRRVIERGYAILRSGRGSVVTDASAAPPGTMLRAELRRGGLTLRSEGPAEPAKENELHDQESRDPERAQLRPGRLPPRGDPGQD